ncbi:MAG: ATP-binding cassette domain-containing protein [Clostridia bacterium]|nr:ATP-binding cassette domain-containing protein [Clostridia bacterium]MDD4685881.1 ATP-binding cassette domain-containing protein [Clostridia bacterium]
MLKLKNIKKTYEMGKKGGKVYQVVHALRNLNIEFRKCEFVSILGPSGCGKTTLLNIIGGLDRYTSGDLIINGKSTKSFADRDWDTYRNHSVGFVFQSYNLIPHQTVLQNVELALTLAGMGKEERRKKATDVLKKVGLGDKLNSKPNQLSGGQMQRVAIARALVNDPEIILADEPTGALDSKTSTQIISLLKEVSKTKLIIMVTHNPVIAETYSTRIIKLLDGELVDDSNAYDSSKETDEQSESALIEKGKAKVAKSSKKTKEVALEKNEESIENKKPKKTKMSIFTALSLSMRNLLTKKTRTFLVSMAGSIGIIGIALILALSNGFQGYMKSVQEDTLSTYPLTINSTSMDYSSLFGAMMNQGQQSSNKEGVVVSKDMILGMFKQITSGMQLNDLKSFKKFLDQNEKVKDLTTDIKYSYNLNFNAYSDQSVQLNPNSMFYDGAMAWMGAHAFNAAYKIKEAEFRETLSDPERELTEEEINLITSQITPEDIENEANKFLASLTSQGGQSMGGFSDFSSLASSDLGLFNELIDNNRLLESQYDVVASTVNVNTLFENLQYNEVVLALDKDGNLNDYALYALGIKTSPTIEEIAMGLVNSDEFVIEPSEFSYEEILGMKYKILPDTDYYLPTGEGDAYVDIRKELKNKDLGQEEYDILVDGLLEDKGIELTIKAIIMPKANAKAVSLTGSVGYSKLLTEHLISYINSQVDEKSLLSALKIDMEIPSSISLYCVDFESKYQIEGIIKDYNQSVDEDSQIAYTDYVGVLMGSVSTIIDSISIVLIAFVAVSLIVSSIMIGIIISISVIERTKEIGVLRSLGASKRDVRRVFTAESLIIGFSAGMFGILTTLLLSIPANIIITNVTGLTNITTLPLLAGGILIVLSMVLTFIAGLLPSKNASKKDPVIALRIE